MRASRNDGALIAAVDDDEGVRAAISSLIRSVGYRCVTFASAEALLESGRLSDTDCMLLDIRMPGMNGLELQLILDEMNREIPIIYVTATSDGAMRERAFNQGAAAFIPAGTDVCRVA